jgi:dienelactone hydrolase
VVSFHGSLNTTVPAKSGLVKSRILVLNGGDDSFITPQSIDAFKQEMENAGVRYEFVNYPGAKHSFTNPDADRYGKAHSLPLAYNARADHESWQAMREFLLAIFGR